MRLGCVIRPGSTVNEAHQRRGRRGASRYMRLVRRRRKKYIRKKR